MKRMQKIAIVESPLQLMCLPKDTQRIIIRTGGCYATLGQFKNLSFKPLFENPFLNDISILVVTCYYRMLFKTNIIYGSYFSRFLKTIQFIFRFSDVTYVDDGIASFKYLQLSLPKKYKFLTIYDELVNNVNITKNTSFLNTCSDDAKCIDLIIGQDLIEEGMLAESEYFEGILGAIDSITDNSDIELQYFPHRRESADRVRKKLQGISVTTPNLPIEVYLLKNNLRVRNLVTYFSSAVFNIKRIICPGANVFILRSSALYEKLENHQRVAYKIIMEDHNEILP